MDLDELSTPAVVVDANVLEANVRRMAERAKAAGVRLRPHAKTHKTAQVARLQLGAGAAGLSVAKTSEAEAFADAGFDDLFVAYPVVGADKARRLLALAERRRLAVGVDSAEGAHTLGRVFKEAGRALDVHLKIDTGFRRVGVLPEHAAEAARRIAEVPGIRLRGVFTHAGHGYLAADRAGVAAVAGDEVRLTVEAAQRIEAAGIKVHEISVGSTPTAAAALQAGGLTECRPGNYVFHDASQVALGTCGREHCALTVIATVVSVPARDRAVIDAGSKTLTTDPLRPRGEGYGEILDTSSRLVRLSEEHGVIGVDPADSFRVGQRVRVLPNHACVVANLHDALWVTRGERVEDRWTVIGRGRVE